MSQFKAISRLWAKRSGVDICRRSFPLRAAYATAAAAPTSEWAKARPFEEIPGYTKWQFIRAFMPGGQFYKKDFAEILRIVNRNFGDIARFPSILGQPNIVLSFKPEDFETVFRNEGTWPVRRAFETMNYHRKEYRKNYFNDVIGVLTTNGEHWGNFRSAVNPVLMQPKTVKNYLTRMSKVSDEFVERIKEIRSVENQEAPENFLNEINRWTLESVTVVALDKHLGLLTSERDNPNIQKFFKNINNIFELTAELEISPPIWKKISTPSFRKMMKTLDELTDFVDVHIQEAVQRLEKEKEANTIKPDEEKSVLEKLIAIDRKVATVMAMDMLIAGVDTTATTFTGIMLCLSKAPEKQEILREEVLKILPEKDCELTEANMKNLPYLRACLKEAQRLYPLGPGIFRGAVKDIVIHGYRVPKGCDVSMANLLLLTDPEYYPRPNEFIPERWLRQDDANKQYIGSKSHPFTYLPFGFGPRSCVGKRIVNMELEIGVCKILRNFRVEFKYPTENIFKNVLINIPVKPLKFTFNDL